ncbi:MAG: hypothetical protein RBG13Loki_4182 [Promethearchaeota archaeon CR_4]|nr:MAG: hypothetical protein RBG13Loki_4182 [Candidatus Lokiarchaeota archaeon CR_4]
MLKIFIRSSVVGGDTHVRRSIRPGRIKAGSRMSGRLVAAMMTRSFVWVKPSSSVSNCEITRSVTPESVAPIPRCGAMASISSKKMMHGAASLAFRKISRIARSDSPTHLLNNSGPLMEMKLASLSVATARASIVFPHPGGP